MWTRFIDAHLHLQDPRFTGKTEQVIAHAAIAGVCRLFCNATAESDWPRIIELADHHSWLIPFLGIHPWNVDSAAAGWENRLYDILSSRRYGAGVGETGLDKARPAEFEKQLKLLQAHLEIAVDLDLPVAVHCVRCWGKLVEVLKAQAAGKRLPRVLIHSFSGSREIMRRLTDLGCFLSFSSHIADPEHSRLREIFSQVPLELLLLETDAPDQINPLLADQEDLITKFNEPVIITAVYRSAAIQRGLHLEDFTRQLWHNATIYAHKALTR